MQSIRGARILLFVAVMLLVVAPVAAQMGAGGFTDNANHFKLKAAPGWVRAGPGLLDAINADQAGFYPNRTWTVSAAWCTSGSEVLMRPYILAEVTPVEFSTMTFADIERAFAAETRPQAAAILKLPITQMVPRLGDDDPLLDRDRKRVVSVRYEQEQGPDGPQTFAYVAVGFLGSASAIHLVFCCDRALLVDYLPAFQQFVDSFQWTQPQWQYTEPTGKSKGGTWTANRSRRGSSASDASGSGGSRPALDSNAKFWYSFGGAGILVLIAGVVVAAARR